MEVAVRIRNTDLAGRLRQYADRRLRFALSRFGGRVDHVHVAIAGASDSEPDAARVCEITAELKPFGEVGVREAHHDLYLAIDRAAGRVGRLLALRFERGGKGIPIRTIKVHEKRTGKGNGEVKLSKKRLRRFR